MAQASVGAVTLEYETHGDPSDPALLLIMGLGAQLTVWDDGFVDELVARGLHVVRFDNRDVGLSTKTTGSPPDLVALIGAAMGGTSPPEVPYTLSEMAADAVGLLDHLGIEAAHVVGASLGGMVAQMVAIEHPARVLSLTSIMSTTGARDVGQATGGTLGLLLGPLPKGREAIVDRGIDVTRAIAGPHFDEDRARRRAETGYDRCHHPVGVAFQMAAVVGTGDRTDRLGGLDVPALVIHGAVDPLVTLSGGEATAAAVPGARLVVLDDMGHDLPEPLWGRIADEIAAVVTRA